MNQEMRGTRAPVWARGFRSQAPASVMGNADGKEGGDAAKVAQEDRFSTVELAPRFDAKVEQENLQQLKKKFPDTPEGTTSIPPC